MLILYICDGRLHNAPALKITYLSEELYRMKLVFSCGVCGKQETLELNDKNKTYLIGRDIEGLDVKLCTDEKSTLSRIQAHIKWDRNAWRIFDGWPPDSISKNDAQLQKPNSFAGTFIKRADEFRLMAHGVGEELRESDNIYFVATIKANKAAVNNWINQAGTDAQAAFYKYDGFLFREDAEYYDGFKYKLTVQSDEERAAKMRASNMFVPLNFSKDLEIGKAHHNSCLGLDIRSSTGADLETQRNYWIPQFNRIMNELLVNYSDYLLILVGDGAYICFLGDREDEDVNFGFAVKFLDRLRLFNAANKKKKIPEWKVRLAVNNGKDLLAQVDIAGQKSLNVYGNTITITARLMAYGKSDGDDIIVGIPFHQEFNNKKYYKSNFVQTEMEAMDNHGVKYHYYVYSKNARLK
jgi:hypothetical protein